MERKCQGVDETSRAGRVLSPLGPLSGTFLVWSSAYLTLRLCDV